MTWEKYLHELVVVTVSARERATAGHPSVGPRRMRVRIPSPRLRWIALMLSALSLALPALSEPIDFFPLRVGQVFTYSYYYESWQYKTFPIYDLQDDYEKDSGLVICEIVDSTRGDDSTTLWRTRVTAYLESIEWHLDSLNRRVTKAWSHVYNSPGVIYETTTGFHRLLGSVAFVSFSAGIYRFVDSKIDTIVYPVRYGPSTAQGTFTRGVGLTRAYHHYYGVGNWSILMGTLDMRLLSVVSVNDGPSPIPGLHVGLHQNYPNPFNASTNIRYELSSSSAVRLSVFDLLGREVSVLVNEWKERGIHTAALDASRLPTGTYFYRLSAGPFVETKRLLLLR